MSKKGKGLALVINIDGASRGNPGPSGIGVVIRDASDGQVICDLSEPHGEMTNNAIEYIALIRALEYAHVLRASSVSIRSDSQLLVRQMTGEYRVKSKQIQPLCRWATDLARTLDSVEFESISRENNREADKLAQKSVRGV
jgi:ribonuclease HI